MQICHIWENAKNLAYKHWMLTFTRARMHNFAQSHAALNGVFYCQQQNLYWSDLAIRTVFSFAHIIYHSVSASPVAKGELNPPNKALSPLNWNMKHYKSVWVCQFLKVSCPPAQTQSPPIENFLAAVLGSTLTIHCCFGFARGDDTFVMNTVYTF